MSTRKASRAAALLESGMRLLRSGQVKQAQESFKELLTLQPGHPDALHLLGVVALQNGNHAEAVKWLQSAVAEQPTNPDYQANLAYCYVGLKRLPEALAAFERAARLAPRDPELQLGVGNCLGLMGRVAEAEGALRRLVEQHPQYALGWFNLAKALDEQGRHDEACELYHRATQLAPRFADAYSNLGGALNRLERYAESERAFRASLELQPDSAAARVNLAIALNHLRRHGEAETLCRQAIARNPAQRGALAMLGKALGGQGRWREAVPCFAKAVSDEPADPELIGYYGDALAFNGRTREALEQFARALDHDPAFFLARFAAGIAVLGAGRVGDGMAGYVFREEKKRFVARHPDRVFHSGVAADFRGDHLCLIGEQGIGDEIFFLRYAPILQSRGVRVTYHGNRKIVSILARAPVLDRVLPNVEPYAPADGTLLLGDLPHFLGTPESCPLPGRGVRPDARPGAASAGARISWHCRIYWPELPRPLVLAPLPERVARVAGMLSQLGPPPYTGLTWRAGTPLEEQGQRAWKLFKEVPSQALALALREIGGTLISLQRNPRPEETDRLSAIAGRPVHDLSATNEDLEDMLALLAVLDEYVGVSNTNMHLRAAAGKTARVLVPWPAEWRWLIAGDESPWFPGFRIYRQASDGNWDNALTRLNQDLKAGLGKR